MVNTRNETTQAAKGGAVAGMLAGIILSIFLVTASIRNGRSIWPSLKGAATPFIGSAAMEPGFVLGPVVLGILCHLTISAGWGLLFGLIFFGLGRVATIISGAFWGIVVWLAMYYVVLPLVGLGAINKAVPIAGAAISHIVFGLMISICFLPFQRHRPAKLLESRRVAAK